MRSTIEDNILYAATPLGLRLQRELQGAGFCSSATPNLTHSKHISPAANNLTSIGVTHLAEAAYKEVVPNKYAQHL